MDDTSFIVVHLDEEILDNSFKDEDVHFVLVYETENKDDKKRQYYEDKLREAGLILSNEQCDNLNFVKIFAPNDVLCRYCEILKLRMPMKMIPGLKEEILSRNQIMKMKRIVINSIDEHLSCRFDAKYKWTAEFSMNKDYLFDVKSDKFFTPAVKSLIINFILERVRFSNISHDVGIGILLNDNVYEAAYPVHDGDTDERGSKREFFSRNWAKNKNIFRYQPLDDIRNYFGVKFALYFAWLEFYTNMLIPAAIVGILSMIYGMYTLSSDHLTNDICNEELNIIMCPQCDKICDYWNIVDACTYAKITHLFDNYGTVFFGFFMSIWSALYVEFWKRYSAEISHRWGLTGFDLDAQHPRPEYLARFEHFKMKKNIVTNQNEPYVPFLRVRLPIMIFSFSLAILWVCLAVAAVFGVVIYRMAGVTVHSMLKENSKIVISVTAGIINLVCITLLNFYYQRLAMYLTKKEFHRTQVEFDDSLTLKIYMFQFVNYYSSLFYIAFLKGKFIGYPKDYNRIFGFRQEECDLGSCMMELFLQLAIIMIGKQALNNFIEIGLPIIISKISGKEKKIKENKSAKQWVKDFALLAWDSKGMFNEYLEMVIQYGFVTLFVTAFPLAPVFAYLNNIFELRIDAKKYLKYYRRPIAQRVKDIGIWFYIIEVLGKISVVSNAFVIAFCSKYIPLMLYSTVYSKNEEGFLNFSLSYFDVADFHNRSIPIKSIFNNVTVCRYSDYRNSYDHKEKKYALDDRYWHILAARLAFIVVYQNVVSIVVMLIKWAIPDIPKKLKDQIKREALRTSEYIIEQETLRANGKINHTSDSRTKSHEA